MQTLPVLTDSASFIQTVHLDDGTATLPLRIKLRWNSRMGATEDGQWLISFYDTLGSPLVLSLPLVINMDMLTRFAKEEFGRGVLYCSHVSGKDAEVGRYDLFNGLASINYLTEEEYAAVTQS